MPECTEAERALLDAIMANDRNWSAKRGAVRAERFTEAQHEHLVQAFLGKLRAQAAFDKAMKPVTDLGFIGDELGVVWEPAEAEAKRRFELERKQ